MKERERERERVRETEVERGKGRGRDIRGGMVESGERECERERDR